MSFWHDTFNDATRLPVRQGHIFRLRRFNSDSSWLAVAFSRYGARVYWFGKLVINMRSESRSVKP